MLGAIIYLFKLFVKLLAIIFLFVVLVFAYISLKTPELNRNWSEESKILPDITISTSTIEVKNLRDWRYEKEEVISKDYYDEEFNLDKITKAYFLMNPFGDWEGVGHTFFVFEFADGKSISVSVEARREVGVEYKAWKGLFNNYEIWYAWGSGADFISRRAVYYDEDLYMYPLLISSSTARALVVDLAETTEKLETESEFYNTILTNCTNVLADSGNRINPGSIPWNYARIFTGFADDKLYDLQLIPYEKPFDEIEKESRIDREIRDVLESNPKIEREEFWTKISQ